MSPNERADKRGVEGASILEVAGVEVGLGENRDLRLGVTQSYSGAGVTLPIRVMRAPEPGPVLLLTAAVHGDELNGTGIIRELMLNPSFELTMGTLILVPVVNILGFERHSRYLPDRRDLNRCFPGSPDGSLAGRIAATVFQELVSRCDYCIDFHTAAVRRTNFPNVRGNMKDPAVRRLAKAFGCELLVDKIGAEGSLRRSATEAGHPTIILEAGEVLKMEPSVVELGVRGVHNVMIKLKMIDGTRVKPAYQARVDRTVWLRSNKGGLLRFHTAPGEVVEKGQPIASCATLLGVEQGMIVSPRDGVVMGFTTLPLVKPGDPVCHLAIPRKGIKRIRRKLGQLPDENLHDRLMGDLGSSVTVDEVDSDT